MRKKMIAGNWKMNGTNLIIQSLVEAILANCPQTLSIDCVIFPPSIYLPLIMELLSGSSIQWGGQNIYPKDFGAFTGEVSCAMLKEYNCRYVLVGHSERRHIFAENEKFVEEKFHNVKEHGMIPVLCVGETLKERENELTTEVLSDQINGLLSTDPNCFENAIIAYEPVWAIGSGYSASAEQVQEAHRAIRQIIASKNEDLAEKVVILYGGSLNEKNAAALFALPDVDGGLIGGASLDAQKFVEIIECIN